MLKHTRSLSSACLQRAPMYSNLLMLASLAYTKKHSVTSPLNMREQLVKMSTRMLFCWLHAGLSIELSLKQIFILLSTRQEFCFWIMEQLVLLMFIIPRKALLLPMLQNPFLQHLRRSLNSGTIPLPSKHQILQDQTIVLQFPHQSDDIDPSQSGDDNLPSLLQDQFNNPVPSPSPSTKMAQKYAGATKVALAGPLFSILSQTHQQKALKSNLPSQFPQLFICTIQTLTYSMSCLTRKRCARTSSISL